VAAASRWYQRLLGCESGHGGSLYDRLVQDGVLRLQLHACDEEDHANLVGADAAPHGHGVPLWFEVDDFDAAVGRVSHRGGPRGFVRLEGQTLTIPDYRGNRYFNTLGNLVSNPRAALLFVDFEEGDLVPLRGTTEIVRDGPELRSFLAAERLWRFSVDRARRKRVALPLRWTARASATG
jgi:hypothetical protein